MRKKTEKEIIAELERTKRYAITAAYELGYMFRFDGIEEDIRNAKTVAEVSRIMSSCRRAS